MKHLLFTTAILLCLAVISPAVVQAGEKQEARIAYVLKNLKLKADAQAKFKPVLAAYYEELKEVKAPYKALKDKLQDAIDANRLTVAQCDQLFNLKEKQEEAEVALRRKYYAKFKTVVTPQQAYKALKLSDDKVK